MKLPLALVLAMLAIAALATADTARVVFPREFAPAEGIVAAPEKPLRQELCLNGSWQFQPVAVPKDFQRDTGTPPDLLLPDAAR